MTESKAKPVRSGARLAALGVAAAVGVVLGLVWLGSAFADPAETATASGVVDGTGASTATAATTGTTTRSDAYVCAAVECPPFNKIANSGFGTGTTQNAATATTTSNGTGGTGISSASYTAPTANANPSGNSNVADAVANASAAPVSGNAANADASIVNNGTNAAGGTGTSGNSARATANGDGGNAASNSLTTINTGSTGVGTTDSASVAQGGGDSQANATSVLTGVGLGSLTADAKADSAGSSSGKSVAISNATNNAGGNGGAVSVGTTATAESQASNHGDSQVLASATNNGSGATASTATTAVSTGSANGVGASVRIDAIADNSTNLATNATATGYATSGTGSTVNDSVTSHATNGASTNANGNASGVGGGIASTNTLITADGSGLTCLTSVSNVCTTPLTVSSHADGIADATVATAGVAAASNSADANNGAQIRNGQVEAAANAAGVAESSIKSDALGTGCAAGAPCNASVNGLGGTLNLPQANLTVSSTIENQKSTSQATGSNSLATSDLKNTALSGGLITNSLSSSDATAGGVAATQLSNTVSFRGKADGSVVATADQGAYASSQCTNIAQGNAYNPGSTGGECNLTSQSTGVFGKQSQAQTAAVNVSLNGGATSMLGAQAGSGAKSDVVSATTDLAAIQPVGALASNALSVAGGCIVGYGCGIIISQANIPGNPTGQDCNGGNAANCATASVVGVTTAINGHSVEGAGLATAIGGQNTPNYGSSGLVATPGLGATFQLDSKSGQGDALASSTIKFSP